MGVHGRAGRTSRACVRGGMREETHFMWKTCLTGCVVALLLASAGAAGAAPGAPGASPEREALALGDYPTPLDIQVGASDVRVFAASVDQVGGVSTVGTTLTSTTVADATPAAIPLPAGVYVGLVGLASTFAAWRRFKRKRI